MLPLRKYRTQAILWVLCILALQILLRCRISEAEAATAIFHGDRGVNKIALTFDDGYKCDTRILDFLEQKGIKATDFVIGSWARQNPSLIRRMANDGWEVCNHTETHPVMTKISDGQILYELGSCQQAITSITGKRYPYFRPPYGAFDARTLAVAESAGYKNIIWDSSDGDTVKGVAPQTEIDAVLNSARNGSIILMHFGGHHTGDILPTIVNSLTARGFRFVTMSELLGDKPKGDGTASAGVTAPSTTWYLAEGYTGKDFDEWILVQNPNSVDAHLNVTYHVKGGGPIWVPYTVPANSRYSIHVDEAPCLGNAEISTEIHSDQAVVAERAMYFGF